MTARNYAHQTVEIDKMVVFMFEDPQSSLVIRQMLHMMFKRKPLIHNGRKPQ